MPNRQDLVLQVIQPVVAKHTGRAVTGVAASRAFGGASRETWMLTYEQAGAGAISVVCRIEQPQSLIETTSRAERWGYELAGSIDGVPVPAVFDSGYSKELGEHFMVTEAINGSPASPFNQDPYGVHSGRIGQQFWNILGHLHHTDVETLPAPPSDVSSGFALEQLDHWMKVIDEDMTRPSPGLALAESWLRNNPPPTPERMHVVHGDYRTGNVLVNGAELVAVLDWEMTHLGDPHEDLAWALSPVWSMPNPSAPGGMIPQHAALALWSATSGIPLNRDSLRWWSLFSTIKGTAIWTSAGREFATGRNTDPVNLFPAWLCNSADEDAMLSLLEAVL